MTDQGIPSTDEGTEESPKVVSRNIIVPNGKITRDHTIKVYGDRAHGKTEDQIEAWRRRLSMLRTGARSWASVQVSRVMLEEVTRQGLSCKTMQELHVSFKKDDSDIMCRKMWEVAYGCFDKHPYWAQDLEEDYMKMMHWQYAPKADMGDA